MRLRWILLLGLVLSAPVLAFDTYRVGSQLIRTGDSVSELLDLLGNPVYKETIETGRGGFVGERWQYRLDGKAVTFTIRDGRIVHIDEIRDER
ncbi:MAG TPA: DUF2845 domain-containing protein [Rhodanobacteraceae bacterium]|jgi:hypothetical protein